MLRGKASEVHPPRPETIRTHARIGQAVEIMLDSHGPHCGVIIHTEPDACVIRLDEPRDTSDGDAPNVVAIAWKDVLLADVRPAIEKVELHDVTPLPTSTESYVFALKPGVRVKIDVGDGNDDKEGTIFHCLPQCCIVKLDEGLKWGGSEYAAAEWHLVTTLPRDDADEQTAAQTAVEMEQWKVAPVEATAKVDDPRIIIPIGARVAIQTGEEDKEGIVVATLPQCCVVWLTDSSTEGSSHTAVDWEYIKPLNIGGEGTAQYGA